MVLSLLDLTLLSMASLVLAYLTYIDARYYLLLDWANALLAILGVIFICLHPTWHSSWHQPLYGAAAGAGIFWLTQRLSLWWKGIEGVGWGDVKFAAAAGIWLGAQGVGLMLLLSSVLLLLLGGAYALLTRRGVSNFYLPFGVAGCPVACALIWGKVLGVLGPLWF